jgi:uncharacterized protein (DUF433 family)
MATSTRKTRTRKVKEARSTYKTRATPRTHTPTKHKPKYSNGRWTTTRATDKVIETDHPYIHKVPGVVGGEPVIKGTRISVSLIANWWRMGWTIKQLLKSYPHLRLAEVCDALWYYDDHREEILAYIEENFVFEDQE